MNDSSGLTHGRVSSLVRLCALASVLLVGAAIALQFAPLQRPPSPSEIANAASRQNALNDEDLFPVFSARLGNRDNPFRFEEMSRAQVQFQQAAPEPTPTPAPQAEPAPAPQPNVEGLTLVGTVPGSRHGFALFLDEQSGQVQTYAIGEPVRNAVLANVLSDRVELVLDDQSAEVRLAKISDGVPAAETTQVAGAAPAVQAAPRQNNRRGNKPALGLSGYMLAPADAQKMGVTNGLLITGVRRSDGLVEVDDVIVKVDGRDFTSTRDVVAMIKAKSAGEPMDLTLMRQSKPVKVTIVL